MKRTAIPVPNAKKAVNHTGQNEPDGLLCSRPGKTVKLAMSTILGKLFTAVLIAISTGCASTHNLENGDGAFDGGYQISRVIDGICYIYARTNGSVSADYEAAKNMFITQAVKTCGSENVGTVNTNSRLDNSKFGFMVVTELTGYAICLDNGLSEQQVREAIRKYENS